MIDYYVQYHLPQAVDYPGRIGGSMDVSGRSTSLLCTDDHQLSIYRGKGWINGGNNLHLWHKVSVTALHDYIVSLEFRTLPIK